MQCPKCQGTMERITVPQAHVHRCTQCKGLWFEMVDHETLKDHAEEIDVGDPTLGEQAMVEHFDLTVKALLAAGVY